VLMCVAADAYDRIIVGQATALGSRQLRRQASAALAATLPRSRTPLLGRASIDVRFAAPAAGSVTLRWVLHRRGVTRTLGLGQASVSAPVTVTVHIPLAAAAVAALRRGGGWRLSAGAVFAPIGGQAVSVTAARSLGA